MNGLVAIEMTVTVQSTAFWHIDCACSFPAHDGWFTGNLKYSTALVFIDGAEDFCNSLEENSESRLDPNLERSKNAV